MKFRVHHPQALIVSSFYRHEGEEIFRSTDSGVTWSETDVRSDTPGRAIGSVLAVDPWHPEAAYLAGYRNGGLYRTGDGGLSWQQVLPYPVSSVATAPAINQNTNPPTLVLLSSAVLYPEGRL